MATIRDWPWAGMDKDALVPRTPLNLAHMQAVSQRVANQTFEPISDDTTQKMREMAAFLVVFGMGKQ